MSECAGLRAGAVGGTIQLKGRRLAGVSEVRFPGPAGPAVVAPSRTKPTSLVAPIPDGAETGRVRVATAGGAEGVSRQRLRIADASQVPDGFRLRSANVRPGRSFFDQGRPTEAGFRFEAPERTEVEVDVIRAKGKKVVRTYRKSVLPYSKNRQRWDALERDGDVADDGTYRFRIGSPGAGSKVAGATTLHGYRFPVRGRHSYGGHLQSFGAPRSGGRRHLGQDIYANCGTRLEAARGGRIQNRDYDPVLLGHYIVIDLRKSSADHLYVHLPSPSPRGKGDRVRTGQHVGAVGKTGNARTTPCHLHFEIWPKGWHHGSPIDPKPLLRRWDGWS